MTIEISRGSAYQYRISPDDPLLIERKANKAGARWTFWLRRDTPNETKRALLEIDRKEAEERK
jgi:hypothetical protein